ncbi:MAG TPA: hypothetical protein V6C58_05135, partial [Allocoleopsis sp.]
MSTLGTNYGVSELRIALALEDAINNYLVNGTMPNEGTLYGISEKRLAIAIAENTSIGGAGGAATWGGINGTLSNQIDLATALSLKQNGLISGTNIKTINSNSLLGSGDLSISASPAGSSGQIQFNNAGLFGASSNLAWDNTNNRLVLANGTISQPSIGFIGQPTSGLSWDASGSKLRIHGGTSNVFEFIRSSDSVARNMSLQNAPFPSFLFESSVWAGGDASGGKIAFGVGGVSDSQLARTGIGKLNFQGSQAQTVLISLGINNSNPLAQLDIVNSSSSQIALSVKGSLGQSSDMQQWVNNSGSVIGAIKADGSYQPASLTDASSTNNSAYFSSTTSRLTYKNSSGVLSSFSGINTGDQSSIVGITGTTAQFNTALTDGDFATLAGTETLTNKVIVRKLSTKAANYTLTNADSLVRFDGTSLTATLPDATTLSGYEFEIKN